MSRLGIALVIIAIVCASAGPIVGQAALAQLGLTETSARNLVMSQLGFAGTDSRTALVETGRRAFFKLPSSARGPAATALFAWAKAYVGSSQFMTSYTQRRREAVGPEGRPNQPSIDEEVQKQIDALKASAAQSRKMAAALPPADAAGLLKAIEEQEARITSGELARMLRVAFEAERTEKTARDAATTKADDERYPADPKRIFARWLRAFLQATADVNFSARTLSLSGGPDDIQFLDKADRRRHWMWQEAVIVGPEATAAARVAAEAWLKEIGQ